MRKAPLHERCSRRCAPPDRSHELRLAGAPRRISALRQRTSTARASACYVFLVPGLTRLPLNLSADWISKTVTTDPPKLMPHEEWRLSLDIEAAAPIYAAVLWYLDDAVSWGLWQYEPSERIQLPLHFFAHDWRTSDEMHLSFGWRRVTLTDARLKADPPHQTTVLAPPRGATGGNHSGLQAPQPSGASRRVYRGEGRRRAPPTSPLASPPRTDRSSPR
jgi:hypothetical protein